MKTYADGLREAARLCEAEIIPPEEREQEEKVVGIQAAKVPAEDRKAMKAYADHMRSILEPTMTIMAHKFRRLASEYEASDTSGEGEVSK